MHKNLEDITLKDLMDKLNEIRLEKRQGSPFLQPLEKISVGGLLSLNDLAEFLGTETSALDLHGQIGERYAFFRPNERPA